MATASAIQDSRSPGMPGSARPVMIAVAGILLLGLVPRLYGLAERSLWFDEAFCWRLVQFPVGEMVERVAQDNHPPLYFLLLKLWATLFGDSAWALRSLSVVFGLAVIAGSYLFAASAFTLDWSAPGQAPDDAPSPLVSRSRWFGPFSALLIAVSGLQIRYSWEMRMYALTAALAVFSSWALVRALEAPESGKRWLLYACLALLLAYSHYYGLFTLASQGVFACLFLWRRAGWQPTVLCRSRGFWYAALSAVAVFLAWLPWLGVFLRQHAQVKAAFWSQPVSLWDVGELCYQVLWQPEYLPRPPSQQLLGALVICAAGVYLVARKASVRDWLLLCLALGPLVCCLLASLWDVPAFTLRYFVPAHVFLVIAAAALVWRIPFRAERLLGCVLVVCFFLAVDFEFYHTLDLDNKPGSRGAAAFLAQERRPGEPVISALPFFHFPLVHYAADRRGCHIYSDGPMPHYYGTAAMTGDDVVNADFLKSVHSRRVVGGRSRGRVPRLSRRARSRRLGRKAPARVCRHVQPGERHRQ